MIHIAIIDDHPASRMFIERLVEAAGHKPMTFESAEEAMDAFNRGPIDVWLIDWMLPGQSGIELVKAVRARSDGRTPYFIMLTSRGSHEDLTLAFEAGVDDFIAKPVGGLEFQARLAGATRIARLTQDLKRRVIDAELLNQRLQSLNDQLALQAQTDALTGLLNRSAGLARLDEAWSAAARHGTPLSIAVVDLDAFKTVNDTYGHAGGDAALRHAAGLLREAVRAEDVVARLGGDEFLLILPGTATDAAVACLERACSRAGQSACRTDAGPVSVVFSAGVAEVSVAIPSQDDLVKTADAALYDAKRAGRGRVIAHRSASRGGLAA